MKKLRLPYLVIFLLLMFINAGYCAQRNENNNLNSTFTMIKKSIYKDAPKNPGGIVFLGDSLTDYSDFNEFYPELFIRNRGIAGDTTKGVLSRIDEIIAIKPEKLFLLIGTNDIVFGRSDDEIVANIKQIISRFKEESTSTKIYVQTLFPTNNNKFQTSRPIENIKAINEGIKKTANELNCKCIDLYPLLLSDSVEELDEKFTIDGIHLNGAGYAKWAEFLAPYVNE